MSKFRPMLSASLPSAKRNVPTADEVIRDLKRLSWEDGFYASPKMDGIRAVNLPELGLVSRTLKQIPNRHIQSVLSDPDFSFLDGELVVGKWDDLVNYNTTQSAVMSEGGTPDFSYCVFDHVQFPDYTFRWRNEHTKKVVDHLNARSDKPPFHLVWLEQVLCRNIDELLEYEEAVVAKGFEGVMLRNIKCRYKYNRSTFLEQGLIKLKRFVDAEGEIVGFEEKYLNDNAPTIDKLGYQKRSAHNDGYIPADTLGKLVLKITTGSFAGSTVSCGSGLDDGLRQLIWNDRESYLGKTVKFKYQEVGSKNLPRAPIFLGFRSGGA